MADLVLQLIVTVERYAAELRDKVSGDCERGQGMVEYGLILALVAIAAVATLGFIGGRVNGAFQQILNVLPAPATA